MTDWNKQRELDGYKEVANAFMQGVAKSVKTEMKETPARADIAATKQTLSIDSVLAYEYEGWMTDFLYTSFYLPIQILKSELITVERVKVITGKEFTDFYGSTEMEEFFVSLEGCNANMLYAAKQVGVSARMRKDNGDKILIFKLWYGRI